MIFRALIVSQLLLAVAPAQADGEGPPIPELELPEPQGPERHVVEARSPQEYYYRSREEAQHLSLRVGTGALWRVSSSPEDSSAIGFDLSLLLVGSFEIARGDGWRPALWPELGYAYQLTGRAYHLGSAGLGLGYQLDWVGLGVVPRFLIGTSGDDNLLGYQTSFLTFLGVGRPLTVELGHRVYFGDVSGHDLSLSVALDIVSLFTYLDSIRW